MKTNACFNHDSVSTCSKDDRLLKRRGMSRRLGELYNLEIHNMQANKAGMEINKM